MATGQAASCDADELFRVFTLPVADVEKHYLILDLRVSALGGVRTHRATLRAQGGPSAQGRLAAASVQRPRPRPPCQPARAHWATRARSRDANRGGQRIDKREGCCVLRAGLEGLQEGAHRLVLLRTPVQQRQGPCRVRQTRAVAPSTPAASGRVLTDSALQGDLRVRRADPCPSQVLKGRVQAQVEHRRLGGQTSVRGTWL